MSMQRRKEESSHGATVITISTGTIFRTILIILAVVFLYLIRDIVVILLVALLWATLIEPFAERLKKVGIPRGVAVALIYALGLALFAGIFLLVVPPTVREFTQLLDVLAPLLAHTPFGDIGNLVNSGSWAQNIENIASTVQQSGVLGALPQVGEILIGAFGVVLAVILILVLAFYMVVEEQVVRRGIALFTPPEYQPFVTQLSVKMREKIGAWMRGQLLIMLVIGVLDYLVLTALGVPYALVLALFGAVMEVIPFLGPNIAAIPALLVGATVSPVHMILVGVGYFVVQQFESAVLTPKIMQKTTGLNPIVTIVAILIGLQIEGMVGALLAIPLAMVISVFYNEVFRQRTEEKV